jgi:hypothetical protein
MTTMTRIQWKTGLASVLLGAALLFGAQEAAFATGTLDDWWLCAEACGDEDAACVDKCTETYNESNVADPIRVLKLKTKAPDTRRTPFAGISGFGARCPAGSVLTPFDMPIYDDNGLFVVGLETVWMCLPVDLEPAG